ncbi:MAG: TonB family protein [Bryobacteraceae bacterium]
METVVESRSSERGDLQLLLPWSDSRDRARHRQAAIGSLLVHVLALTGFMLAPPTKSAAPRRVAMVRQVTPLVAPPPELTQRDPNKGRISKEFNVESLLPRPRVQIPPSPPSTTRPAAPRPFLPTTRPSVTPTLPEPPKVEVAENSGPLHGLPQQQEIAPPPPPPPQIAPEEPKLAFETPQSAQVPRPPERSQVLGRLPPSAANTVTEALRTIAQGRGASGGLMVGDIGVGVGGLGEGLNLPPSPGRAGSNLELLSDPMGVDFRPYLIRILSAVRRNWRAVIPESAKLGRRGKVAIQFAISREGNVPKLVIVTPSGAEALDRAAVAGVSASNPFPPLPAEYKGREIRLQFTFMYNMPKN